MCQGGTVMCRARQRQWPETVLVKPQASSQLLPPPQAWDRPSCSGREMLAGWHCQVQAELCHQSPHPGPSPTPQAAQHPLLPPKGHRKYTSAQSPREGAQALLRKSFQAPKVTPSQLQAPKEAASILRPRFTCLCNGNIHTTLPGALCLLPREEGALDFPQASGTVCDFMDTASQDAQTALGVAWLLGPGLAYWPWREGCSGNSGIIFINTKHVPWGGVDFCSMAGSKTMFLYLITSY